MIKKYYFVLLICLSPLFLFSQWNLNTTVNTSVASATKDQTNIHMVTDANGGTIIAWDDKRNNATSASDIYAQRLDKFGNAKWTANGVAICTFDSTQKNVTIIDLGDGSAIMAWEDGRAGNMDIYAQKIDSSGTILWTIDGVALTTKITTQRNPKIISDNAGGAIIVWNDSANLSYDIYAQRINSSGIVQWTTNGVGVCTAADLQINPKIDIDGAGGAIITWQDKRNGNDYDIYTQHINASGTALWASNGVIICNSTNTQSNPRIEPDGTKGAIISWVDKRNGLDYNIYAQRIDSTGTIKWANNGIVVCNAVGNQSAVDMKYLGTNGVIISWKDFRNNTYQIYSQLVNLAGAVQLTANGILLSNSIKAINPNAIASGQGTGIIVWQDSSAAGWDIKSQKLSSTGIIQWNVGGKVICDAVDDQINASNVSDGNGGAIFAWEDFRNGNDFDIFAHHLTDTVVSTGLTNFKKLKTKCFPNPVTESNSIINLVSENNLEQIVHIYNTTGQLIISKSTNNKGICLIDAYQLDNGFYFFKIESEHNSSIEVGSFIVTK